MYAKMVQYIIFENEHQFSPQRSACRGHLYENLIGKGTSMLGLLGSYIDVPQTGKPSVKLHEPSENKQKIRTLSFQE